MPLLCVLGRCFKGGADAPPPLPPPTTTVPIPAAPARSTRAGDGAPQALPRPRATQGKPRLLSPGSRGGGGVARSVASERVGGRGAGFRLLRHSSCSRPKQQLLCPHPSGRPGSTALFNLFQPPPPPPERFKTLKRGAARGALACPFNFRPARPRARGETPRPTTTPQETASARPTAAEPPRAGGGGGAGRGGP